MNYCQFRNDFIKRMCNSVKPLLPREYQQVEYLYADTNGQYIDTGLSPDSTFKWELDIKYSALPASWTFQNGLSQQPSGDRFIIGALDASTAYLCMGGNNTATCNVTDRHTYTIDLPNNLYSIDSTLYNGTSTYNKSANYTVALFWRNSAGNFYYNQKVIGYIYRSKMYSSGNVIQDLIPCYRKSDNKPGMYDLVTNTFFTNAGTGEFTVGNPI